MELVMYFQKIATSFLTFLFSIFDKLSTLSFFVFVFSILFLVVDKKIGYKYFLSLCISFLSGTVFLKNVVRRQRPYELDNSIITERNSYSYSLPSTSCTLASASYFAVRSSLKQKNSLNPFKKSFSIIALLCFVYCLMVGVAKIYFATNFLLDVIVGFALGGLVSYFIFKYVKVNLKLKKVFSVILGVASLALFCFYAKDFSTNDFSHAIIFEYCGMSLSVLIGTIIEEKWIKYEIKNNLILVWLKTLILIVFSLGYYFLNFIIPGLLIFEFVKMFVMGIMVTVVFPLLFKYLQKYCYMFSPNVKEDKMIISFISTSEKATIKFCNKIANYIKDGDCILLDGEMGSGKSFVVRSILKHFGVNKRVTSPTFTLFNDYKTDTKHFYHFDLYRLEDENEVTNFGFEEIIDDKKSIKFIEWPEKAPQYMPKNYKKITILKLSKRARNIILEDYTK